MRRTLVMALLAALAVGANGCAAQPEAAAASPLDAGAAQLGDAAGGADSAPRAPAPDATGDAAVDAPPVAGGPQLVAPTGPRRGPIVLRLTESAGLKPADLAGAVLEFDAGGGWSKATLASAWQAQGDGWSAVWDSFADVASDSAVQLRLKLAAATAATSCALRNDPETARLVLTAHPSIDLPSGGSAPRNTVVSALRWQGGALAGPAAKLEVGKGPMELHAAPHGRATALIADFDGTWWLVRTPLDAAAGAVAIDGPLALPHGQPSDLAWSADGRSLYVLGTQGSGPAQPAVLWRYDPAEDLSAVGDPVPLATFDRPAMALGVERRHPPGRDEWAYVVLGPGASAKLGQLAAVQSTGGLAAPLLDTDVGVPNDFAVSPAGGLGLLSSDLFGNEVIRYGLANPLDEVARFEPAKVPYHIVFHPASTADKHIALVSNLDKNAVTPLVVSAAGVTPGAAVTGLPLAAEMDLIERGSHAGVVLVSALNQLVAIQLSSAGAASKLGQAWDFGGGTGNFTGAVAIQR